MLEFADGERFVGSPAIAPLYNRGQEYRRRRISQEGDFCDWFAIGPNIVREIVGRFDGRAANTERPFAFTHALVTPEDYLEQRAVVDHLARGDAADALFVEETAFTVLARLLARAYAHSAAAATRSQKELAHAAGAVLASTFNRNWPLARIAREVGCSSFHLARSFKRITGMTLHQQRLLLRLHASLALLRDTTRDLTTIALDLGFGDHSHFTVAFRRRFGITPSRYRARATFS
jgi:AraC-like DNA-binding protein